MSPLQQSEYKLTLNDYGDLYRLRSLLLRASEGGGRLLSAQDQGDAQMYAGRLSEELARAEEAGMSDGQRINGLEQLLGRAVHYERALRQIAARVDIDANGEVMILDQPALSAHEANEVARRALVAVQEALEATRRGRTASESKSVMRKGKQG